MRFVLDAFAVGFFTSCTHGEDSFNPVKVKKENEVSSRTREFEIAPFLKKKPRVNRFSHLLLAS
jgi:hypothetical protein